MKRLLHAACSRGRCSRLALLLLLACAATPGQAYDKISVVIESESAAATEFVQALRKDLENRGDKPYSVNVVHGVSGIGTTADAAPDLIIAVGVQALQQTAALAEHRQILGVLIPLQAYQRIRVQHPANHALTAIPLDQPYARQLALLRHLLPTAKQVGLLLGPSNAELAAHVTRAAPAYQLNTLVRTIDSESLLPTALGQLLPACDVLLATPDPLVYTRETAQTILLTSYRHQKPVIGFSKAYVTAGALAAVYSKPEQIARQAADIIVQGASRNAALPPTLSPQYFSVAINRQVARSLGITTDSEMSLADKIRNEEVSP